MRKTLILIVLVSLMVSVTSVLTSSCKSNSNKWVYYDETYCADFWKYSGNNEVLKQNIVDFFKTEGVSILDLEIYVDRTEEINNTCQNKTGRRVKCKVKEKDVSRMKSRGFYE